MCEEQQSRYVQTFIGSKTKLSGRASNLPGAGWQSSRLRSAMGKDLRCTFFVLEIFGVYISILACSRMICTWQHSKAHCILICVVWLAIASLLHSRFMFAILLLIVHPLARHFRGWTGRRKAEYRRAHFEAQGPQRHHHWIPFACLNMCCVTRPEN